MPPAQPPKTSTRGTDTGITTRIGAVQTENDESEDTVVTRSEIKDPRQSQTAEWLNVSTQYENPLLDPQVATQTEVSVQEAAVQTIPLADIRSLLSAVERWGIFVWRVRRLSKLRKIKVQITDYLHNFDELYVRTTTALQSSSGSS